MHWFFTDNNGKPVIAQWPNLPLWVWLVALVLGRLTDGTAASVFSAIATTAIIMWAVLEIVSNTSPFRRTLGAAVLTFILVQLFT